MNHEDGYNVNEFLNPSFKNDINNVFEKEKEKLEMELFREREDKILKEAEEEKKRKKRVLFEAYLNQKFGHRIFIAVRRSLIVVFFLSFMACFYFIYPKLFENFNIINHVYDLILFSIFFIILDVISCYTIFYWIEITIGIMLENFYRKDYIEPKNL